MPVNEQRPDLRLVGRAIRNRCTAVYVVAIATGSYGRTAVFSTGAQHSRLPLSFRRPCAVRYSPLPPPQRAGVRLLRIGVGRAGIQPGQSVGAPGRVARAVGDVGGQAHGRSGDPGQRMQRDLHTLDHLPVIAPQQAALRHAAGRAACDQRRGPRALGLGAAPAAGRRGAPVSRGGRPVCCVSMRPCGGVPCLRGATAAACGVEFLRRALW